MNSHTRSGRQRGPFSCENEHYRNQTAALDDGVHTGISGPAPSPIGFSNGPWWRGRRRGTLTSAGEHLWVVTRGTRLKLHGRRKNR